MGKIIESIMRDIENTMGLEAYEQLNEDIKKFGMSEDDNIFCLDDVKATKIKWLWYPYIPLGKLTIIQGDPGLGKTFVATQLTAIVSSGRTFPFCDDERNSILGNVVFQSADDGYDDTIKPRLLKAGADCSRVFAINEKGTRLSFDDSRLREIIWKQRPKLVIIDPLTVYIGADVDSHRGNEVYSMMTKLTDLAAEFGCAVVLIGHLNKSQGNKAIYRGVGSIAFMGAVRSVLGVCEMPGDNNKRVLFQIKLNVAAKGQSMIFEIDSESRFSWVGLSDFSADELLENQKPKKNESIALNKCIEFIRGMLSDGSAYSSDVIAAAMKSGHTTPTFKRATNVIKESGDLVTYKEKGSGGKWVMSLKENH